MEDNDKHMRQKKDKLTLLKNHDQTIIDFQIEHANMVKKDLLVKDKKKTLFRRHKRWIIANYRAHCI